jgi:hypothetical protein
MRSSIACSCQVKEKGMGGVRGAHGEINAYEILVGILEDRTTFERCRWG